MDTDQDPWVQQMEERMNTDDDGTKYSQTPDGKKVIAFFTSMTLLVIFSAVVFGAVVLARLAWTGIFG